MRDPLAGDVEVAQDQRQDALADRAETEDDDAAGNVCVNGVGEGSIWGLQ